MKNVKYVGYADKVYVHGKVWNGHGDVVAVSDEDAEALGNDARFVMTGGTPAGTSTGNTGTDNEDDGDDEE